MVLQWNSYRKCSHMHNINSTLVQMNTSLSNWMLKVNLHTFWQLRRSYRCYLLLLCSLPPPSLHAPADTEQTCHVMSRTQSATSRSELTHFIGYLRAASATCDIITSCLCTRRECGVGAGRRRGGIFPALSLLLHAAPRTLPLITLAATVFTTNAFQLLNEIKNFEIIWTTFWLNAIISQLKFLSLVFYQNTT